MNVSAWLEHAVARLTAAGVDAAPLEAQVLAAHSLQVGRGLLITRMESLIPDSAMQLLERRERREPLAYILGYREFYGRRFSVSPDVLIPRQETETVLEVAIIAAGFGARVLDVGTGSGCLAISLKLERADLDVWACDISPGALEVAKSNASALGADVTFLESDIFGRTATRFDLVVSNPPYIAQGTVLQPEIARHEPAMALYGGVDGFEIYRRFAHDAGHALGRGGVLVLEVGDGQAETVIDLFKGWTVLERRHDLLGTVRAITLAPS